MSADAVRDAGDQVGRKGYLSRVGYIVRVQVADAVQLRDETARLPKPPHGKFQVAAASDPDLVPQRAAVGASVSPAHSHLGAHYTKGLSERSLRQTTADRPDLFRLSVGHRFSGPLERENAQRQTLPL